LPEALLLIRPDGEVSFLNAAAEALLGYPRAEVIGRPVTMLLPADARQRVDVAAWLARWGEHPDPEQWRYLHLQGRTSDGSDLRLAVRVGRFAAGDPPLYAVTFRDVSETLRDHAEWKH
ncbi:MAG: PAS domain S-box protein, partial [Gammaproteobacteria bacterium]|nr:PAS domain S-box protein [Gammaproteobacteria bacterium]